MKILVRVDSGVDNRLKGFPRVDNLGNPRTPRPAYLTVSLWGSGQQKKEEDKKKKEICPTWIRQYCSPIARIGDGNFRWKPGNSNRDGSSLAVGPLVVHRDLQAGTLQAIEAVMIPQILGRNNLAKESEETFPFFLRISNGSPSYPRPLKRLRLHVCCGPHRVCLVSTPSTKKGSFRREEGRGHDQEDE